jgi:hypothetical protein
MKTFLCGLFLFGLLAGACLGLKAAEPCRCQIRVVDAEHRPVAGAEVAGTPAYFNPAINPNAALEWRGVTDAQGVASFVVSSSMSYAFLALKPGLAAGWIRLDVRSGVVETNGEIELGAPTFLAGIVKDDKGRPLADTEVWISGAWVKGARAQLQDARPMPARLGRKYLAGRSDGAGAFKIARLPNYASLALEAEKSGMVLDARNTFYRYQPGQSEIELKLVAAANIEGKVVDLVTGAPVAGARIRPFDRFQPLAPESKPTDVSGVFSLRDVQPGQIELRVSMGTNAFVDWVCEPLRLDLKPGETRRDVTIAASRGGMAEVSILAGKDGQPLTNASVLCLKAGRHYQTLALTQGVARLRLPPGAYEFSANQTGWIIERARVAIGLGKTNRVTLKAQPTTMLTGVVQDVEGRPAADLAVGILPLSAELARTDASGHFSLEFDVQRLAGDQPYQLIARDPARNLAIVIEVGAWITNGGGIARLETGLSLAGRIVNKQGQGIGNAELQLAILEDSFQTYFSCANGVDAEGRFELKGLPVARRYQIEVGAAGYDAALRTVEASPTNVFRVELKPIRLAAANQAVAGVVLDENDRPAPGANVTGGPQGSRVVADEHGRFVLRGASDGENTLTAEAGGARGSVVVAGGDTNAIIFLGENQGQLATGTRRTARFLGTVLDPGGQPAPQIRIWRFPDLVDRPGLTTDAQGHFRISLSALGSGARQKQYVVFALDDAHHLAATANVDSEATAAVLRLEPTWTWRGRAVAPNASPVTNAVAQAFYCGPDCARSFGGSASADAKGNLEVKGLPQGRPFRIDLTAPGYGRVTRAVDAPAKGDAATEPEIIEMMVANLPLGGVALNDKNQPISGASISVSGANQPQTGCQTDKAGQFFMAALCPGPILLSGNGPHGEFTSLTVNAGETNLVLRLGSPYEQQNGAPLPKVRGLVLNADGTPATNAQVALRPGGLGNARTDHQGRFEMTRDLELLGVELVDQVVLAWDLDRNLAASADYDETVTNTVLRLEPAWTLSGVVVDTAGQPIRKCHVHVAYHNEDLGTSFGEPVDTGADGRFEFKGLPPGRPYQLMGDAKGYGYGKLKLPAPARETRQVEAPPFVLQLANLTLAGVVLDEQEQPVRGAMVNISGAGQSESRAQTDAQGRFLFRGICPGPIQVSANNSRGSYGGGTAQGGDTNVVLQFGARGRERIARGDADRKIPGQVTDAEGRPASGIGILMFPNDLSRAQSDAEGRFTLHLNNGDEPGSARQSVVFALDSRRNLAASLEVDEDSTNAHLILEPGWTLSGRVRDANGAAITNARAELSYRLGRWVDPCGVFGVTDQEGRFEFQGLPPGRALRVQVSAKGYGRVQIPDVLPEAGTNRVEIAAVTLPAANLLLGGQVLDENEKPVQRVSVRCLNKEGSTGSAQTDSQGRFLIKGLYPGDAQLSVNDERGRYVSESAEVGDTNVILRFNAEPGRTSIKVPPAPQIYGRVVDAAGQPVPRIRLVILPYGQEGIRSDAQGRFSIDPSPWSFAGSSRQFVLAASDPANHRAGSLDLDGGATNAVIQLEPAVAIEGRVAGADGAGITNAQVQLSIHLGNMSGPFVPPLKADAEGRFSFKGLPPGFDYQLLVTANGYSRGRTNLVLAGSSPARVALDPLTLFAANLPLGGVVLDAKGRPAAGMRVQFASENQPSGYRLTDRQGRFLFKKACPGKVRVSANNWDGQFATVAAQGGDTNLVLQLADSRKNTAAKPKINGTVVDAEGRPVPNARVLCWPVTRGQKRTDAEGRFVLTPGQEYRAYGMFKPVVSVVDAGRNLAAALELDEQTTSVKLKLIPAWTLAGRVLGANAAPVTNAQAQLIFRQGTNALPQGQPVTVDADGRFRFTGLPRGMAFNALITADGYGNVQIKEVLPAEGKDRVELDAVDLPSAQLTLSGVVLDEKEQPVRGAVVCFRSDRQSGGSRLTDRQGRFSFREVCAGDLSVEVRDTLGKTGSLSAHGGETNLVLRIKASERSVPSTGLDVIR